MKLYRIESSPCEDGRTFIHVHEYEVVKETPKGYWIMLSNFDVTRRWVPKISQKKFACSTVKSAMESFVARKKRQIKILQAQLDRAKSAFATGTEKLKAIRQPPSDEHTNQCRKCGTFNWSTARHCALCDNVIGVELRPSNLFQL